MMKIMQLVGGFPLSAVIKQHEKELQEFLRTVPIGRGQHGIDSFLNQYLDALRLPDAPSGK